MSFDFCCCGKESTYKIVVGRAKDIKGPYVDKGGALLEEGGGTVVLEGDSRWAGLGHNSAYTFDGVDYLVFHAYDTKDNGKPKLRIGKLSWEQDWPVAIKDQDKEF